MTATNSVTLTLADALQLATQHHRAGRLPEAEGLYRQILAAAPDCIDAWQLLGALALQVGKPEAALELIDKAIALSPADSPNLADFYANRGEALRSMGQHSDAVAALQQAIKLNPAHVPAHNNLGIVLRDMGRASEAVQVLERAIALRPEHIQAQNNLALAYRSLGRDAEALAAFERALALNPNLAEAQHNHADLAREQGNFSTALNGYQRALALKPDFTDAYYGYFVTLRDALKAEPANEEVEAPAPEPLPGTPEFSVLVCSHRPERLPALRTSFAHALAGSAWELIVIDDARSLAEGYNRAVAKSSGRFLIFSHDDITVLSADLAATLRQQLAEADLIGIAGSEVAASGHWQEAGWPHLHGMVCRPLPPNEGQGVNVCIFGTSAPLIPNIQAIDGCFFAARRELCAQLPFDAATFDGFHLYDLDFSYAAHLAGHRVAVSTAIVVAHDSAGNYDREWQRHAQRFVDKYQQTLPSVPLRPRYYPMATLPDLASARRFAEQVAALRVSNATVAPQEDGSYQQWIERYEKAARDPVQLAAAVAALPRQPLLSVLMPVYDPNPVWLAEALDSLLAQAYPHWELCAIDDASPDPAVRQLLDDYAARDARIRVLHRPSNGHICAASNDALAMAAGEFIVLLDHDDLLPPHALYWVARTLCEQPEATLIYSDEDKLGDDGCRRDPYFKPDWNPDLFRSQNVISHLGCYRTELVRELGGFRIGYEGSQDYDLALRVVERSRPEQIRHIPRVLYHWRLHAGSTSAGGEAKPYTVNAAERALNDHLQRTGQAASAAATSTGYRVRYALPQPAPRVTLIMPTRDGHYLQAAVASLFANTDYPAWELLIVDNGSKLPETLAFLAELEASGRAGVMRDARPFNYSALNNAAAAQAEGDVLLFINDDVEAAAPDWLSELVSQAVRPEIAAVGARLWYPNGTVQHAGVILVGGVAAHAHANLPREACGYFGRATLAANFSAVTAACMAIAKHKFFEVGGFDEQLAVAFNDVDLCLRLQQAGYWNLWTPYSELIHHESVSRGQDTSPAKRARFHSEVSFMKQRWGELLQQDPCYSPNLTHNRLDFSLAWPPRLSEFLSV